MTQGKEGDWEARALALIEREWKWVVLLVWLGFCAFFLYDKWDQIRA